MARLKRINKDSMVAGVCTGLSEHLNISVDLIRILFVVLHFTTFPVFLIYIILWIVLPEKK